MSPAVEIRDHLTNNGIAGSGPSAYRLSAASEPTEPDNAITLYDTGGDNTLQIDIGLRAPSIQVRVRSFSYEDAMAKQEAIHDLLVLPTSRSIGTHHYVGVYLQGDILFIGRDEKDRFLTTANYRLYRQSIGDST